jgi:ferredoxin-NADP reductase
MKVSFDHSQQETEDIITYFFKPQQTVNYTAGQFIELTLPHSFPDDRGIKRWFTLSSSPTQQLLSITTQITDSGGSSFKKALQNLGPGVELAMSDPMGDFVLPKIIQTPLIFVAGGIGITPFHSIFSWLSDVNENRPIKFVYAVESEDEIIFQPLLEKANIHATIVIENPSSAWGGEQGELSAEMILGLEQPSDDTLIYISGPETMVEKLAFQLQKLNVHKRQIVTDFFPGYRNI